MRAAAISEFGDLGVLRVTEADEPVAGPGQVLLRVLYAGLNHLDIWVRKGRPGAHLKMPHVLGSDAVGTVVAIGEGVSRPRVGEQVVVYPGLSCGSCEFCLRGEQSLCATFGIIGLSAPGTFAELAVVLLSPILCGWGAWNADG
jgi:NADPH:quinone reductase-like Zn-dependent oxidoreductase